VDHDWSDKIMVGVIKNKEEKQGKKLLAGPSYCASSG